MKRELILSLVLFFSVLFFQISHVDASQLNQIEKIALDQFPRRASECFTVNSSLSQEELEALHSRKGITSLDLRAISSNLAPLALFRKGFPSIKELYIGRVSFFEQILETLPNSMPFLTTLVLDSPIIESDMLHYLSKLTSLRLLKLSQVQIMKAEHIEELLDSNQELSVYISVPQNAISLSLISTFSQCKRIQLEN